jgi:hypothetical protein
MLDRPGGADLLAQARKDFEAEILPYVAPGARYTAHMVMRAMDIAGRELAGGEASMRAAYLRLTAFLGEETLTVPAGAELEAATIAFGRRLALAIRAGALDGDARLPPLLRALTADALAFSNPKALRADRPGSSD